ncbi:hypothetical protein OG21DRAFT_270401 [Imleria badia]|nr:hypothetical protein OG21DRAFT_270401 [Imleria badia]
MIYQNDVNEIKTSTDKIARSNFEQIQFIENFMATAGTGRLPTVVSRGHVTLVDATGREHPMLLDQCRYLDQLDLMLHASLFRCRPDEAEIQRWYTKRKQYDFVIYNRTNSDVIQLTRESDIWSNMKPGARIVMRAITEEEVDSTVTTTYKCPCGTSHAVDVTVGNLVAALEHGCTITCQHCERRFQIAHTQRKQYATDNTKSVDGANPTPVAEANYLIRNFLAKQVNVQASLPETICCWRNPDDRICGAVLSWKSVLTHLRDSHGMN